MYIIAIDTGTTNTRCTLLDEARREIAAQKRPVGVRITAIEGSNATLKATIRECLEELLAQAGIGYDQVSQVLASGMITSNVGLYELPHVAAPAGKEDLAKNAVCVLIEDVCPLPIWFIPGVKNTYAQVTTENFEQMDMMRGEEVETVAIVEQYPRGKDYLLVLPGSHTKFVSVDAQGRMTGCLTTIGGELLSAIVNDTIIADAVGRKFVDAENYDRELFLLGYHTAQKVGVARACFSGRILNTFAISDKTRIGNYITGAALQGDIAALKYSSALPVTPGTTVIVSGKEPLCTMLADLLKADGYFQDVVTYQSPAGTSLSAQGACIVAACK